MDLQKKPITKQTFRGAHHCRHCGEKHARELRRANHNNPLQLEADVIALIQYGLQHDLIETFGIQKESIARHFEVPEHQIAFIFMRLNQRGLLCQPDHKAPHDSTRDYSPGGGGWDSAWMGSYYVVRREAFAALTQETPDPITKHRKTSP